MNKKIELWSSESLTFSNCYHDGIVSVIVLLSLSFHPLTEAGLSLIAPSNHLLFFVFICVFIRCHVSGWWLQLKIVILTSLETVKICHQIYCKAKKYQPSNTNACSEVCMLSMSFKVVEINTHYFHGLFSWAAGYQAYFL